MIAGRHTVAELAELLAAKDYDIAQVQTRANETVGGWTAKNAAEATAWGVDWARLLARYTTAKTDAAPTLILAGPLSPRSLLPLPSEDTWNAVLRALSPVPGVVTPDSFQGLVMRLMAQSGPIDFSGQPQPTSTDPDLQAFKVTDAIVQALPDPPRPPADNTKLIIALGLGLALVIAIKR